MNVDGVVDGRLTSKFFAILLCQNGISRWHRDECDGDVRCNSNSLEWPRFAPFVLEAIFDVSGYSIYTTM